jgi:predicted RNase H-like HicB family nuclease
MTEYIANLRKDTGPGKGSDYGVSFPDFPGWAEEVPKERPGGRSK